jgi:hypothetical protein
MVWPQLGQGPETPAIVEGTVSLVWQWGQSKMIVAGSMAQEGVWLAGQRPEL